METLSKYILIVFGVFFICVGMLMIIRPEKARSIIKKAGSTNLINYSEIAIRMIPAAALIIYADVSKYPQVFKVFGWFMLTTSVILFFVPRHLHHKFSSSSADVLKPVYVRLIAPFAILTGSLIIYFVV